MISIQRIVRNQKWLLYFRANLSNVNRNLEPMDHQKQLLQNKSDSNPKFAPNQIPRLPPSLQSEKEVDLLLLSKTIFVEKTLDKFLLTLHQLQRREFPLSTFLTRIPFLSTGLHFIQNNRHVCSDTALFGILKSYSDVLYQWNLLSSREQQQLLNVLDRIPKQLIFANFESYADYLSILEGLQIPWRNLPIERRKEILSHLPLFGDPQSHTLINLNKLVNAFAELRISTTEGEMSNEVKLYYSRLLTLYEEKLRQEKVQGLRQVGYSLFHELMNINQGRRNDQLNLIYSHLKGEWQQLSHGRQNFIISGLGSMSIHYKAVPSEIWEKMMRETIEKLPKANYKSLYRFFQGWEGMNYHWKYMPTELQLAVCEVLEKIVSSENSSLASSEIPALLGLWRNVGVEWKDFPVKTAELLLLKAPQHVEKIFPLSAELPSLGTSISAVTIEHLPQALRHICNLGIRNRSNVSEYGRTSELQSFLSRWITTFSQQPKLCSNPLILEILTRYVDLKYSWFQLDHEQNKELLNVLNHIPVKKRITRQFSFYSYYFSILEGLQIPWMNLPTKRRKEILSHLPLFGDPQSHTLINLNKLVNAFAELRISTTEGEMSNEVKLYYSELLTRYEEKLRQAKKVQGLRQVGYSLFHELTNINQGLSDDQLTLIYSHLRREWQQLDLSQQNFIISRLGSMAIHYKAVPSEIWEKMMRETIKQLGKANYKSLYRFFQGWERMSYHWKCMPIELQLAVCEVLEKIVSLETLTPESDEFTKLLALWRKVGVEWKDFPAKTAELLLLKAPQHVEKIFPLSAELPSLGTSISAVTIEHLPQALGHIYNLGIRCHNSEYSEYYRSSELRSFLNRWMTSFSQQPKLCSNQLILEILRNYVDLEYYWSKLNHEQKEELLNVLNHIPVNTITATFSNYAEYLSILEGLQIPWTEFSSEKRNEIFSWMELLGDAQPPSISDLQKLVHASSFLLLTKSEEEMPESVKNYYKKILIQYEEKLRQEKEDSEKNGEMTGEVHHIGGFVLLCELKNVNKSLTQDQLNLIYYFLQRDWHHMNHHQQMITISVLGELAIPFHTLPQNLKTIMTEGWSESLQKVNKSRNLEILLAGWVRMGYQWTLMPKQLQETILEVFGKFFPSEENPSSPKTFAYLFGKLGLQWADLPSDIAAMLLNSIPQTISDMTPFDLGQNLAFLGSMKLSKYDITDTVKEAIELGVNRVSQQDNGDILNDPSASTRLLFGFSELQFEWSDLSRHNQRALMAMIQASAPAFNQLQVANVAFALAIMNHNHNIESWQKDDFLSLHSSVLRRCLEVVQSKGSLLPEHGHQIAIYFEWLETLPSSIFRSLLSSVGLSSPFQLPFIEDNGWPLSSPAHIKFAAILQSKWEEMMDMEPSLERARHFHRIHFMNKFQGLSRQVYPVDIGVVYEEEHDNQNHQTIFFIEIIPIDDRLCTIRTTDSQRVLILSHKLKRVLYQRRYPEIELLEVSVHTDADYEQQSQLVIQKILKFMDEKYQTTIVKDE